MKSICIFGAGKSATVLIDYLLKESLKEHWKIILVDGNKELAEKKYELLKGEQYLVRKKKTMDYLMQKGYEPDLVWRLLKEVIFD